MPTPSKAAIYARISLDAEGEGKGVKRQIEDCRKLADHLGWTVVDQYVDNDQSAYSGRRRPEYERLLQDIESKAVDAVLVYNMDRLTRQPKEFERFNDIANGAGLSAVRFVTGDMDFGTDDGLFIGRIQAAMAAKESATKSRRIRRKNDERAEEGLPHGGSQRPFGFEDDRITHRPSEAAAIGTLADRYLAGESLGSLAKWLEAEGIRTVTGKPWRTNVIRTLLLSHRIAGAREHRGELSPAAWKPIISQEKRERLLATFESRKASGRRTPRRYLLSGLLRCSLCDGLLYSATRETTRRYVCTSGPDHGGCGKITIVAAPVEQLIADAVLFRLDTPEMADALAGKERQDTETAELAESLSADREQLTELAEAYANRQLSMNEWSTARKIIETRIRTTERTLRRATNTHELATVVGHGEELRRQWGNLNLGRQAAIVRIVLDHASISPGIRGARSVDHNRVKPIWRL